MCFWVMASGVGSLFLLVDCKGLVKMQKSKLSGMAEMGPSGRAAFTSGGAGNVTKCAHCLLRAVSEQQTGMLAFSC